MNRLVACLFAILGLLSISTAQAINDPKICTVTSPDGQPVASAIVEVWRAGGRGTGLLDLDYNSQGKEQIGVEEIAAVFD